MGRATAVAAHALDIQAPSEVVLLVDGVFCEAALRPTGRTALSQHQRVPFKVDRREAIGFLGDVEYDYRVFVGDRALVGVTGMLGFPFPSYQLPTSSIRQSGPDSVTRARLPTGFQFGHTFYGFQFLP